MTEVLYKQVVDQIKESEHEQVLSTLDKILKEQPNDEPTNIAKVIALIQNGQFDKALDVIKQKNLDGKLGFEKAYALYRANKLNEALTAVNALKQEDNVLQLKAQIFYKLEQFDKSSVAYEDILKKQKKVDEETLTNLTAALTLGDKFNEALAAIKRADNNTFELEYNASCAAIGIKDLDQAEKHLKLAKDLCRETLEEENYTEEEILDESAGILTQLAFVKQLRGQSEEARNLYDTVIKAKPSDAVVLAVASNNSISLKGSESDLFDSVKKMKHTTSQKVQGKLTPAQQRGISLNSTLLLLLQKKYDECKEAVASLTKQFPDSDINPLILAAMHYKEKQFEDAVKTLQAYIDKHPSEKTLRVQITLAQLHLNQGNIEEVIKILQATPVRYEPSVIATIISLYQKTNNIDSCINVLDQSIQYWREKYEKGDKSVKDKLLLMLNKNAQYKMSVNKYQEAAATYELLVKVDPENKEHVAGLVNALSHFDIAKAETYTKQLPSIDIGDINAENLESETVLAFRSKKQNVDVLDINKESSSSQEKKKKKKRKNKPAKNFSAKKQPDPERWLPLKMRTAYQKKGPGMRSASQGSSVEGVQQKLQVKKNENVKTPSPATPAASATSAAPSKPQPPKSTLGPKGARNKKKKR